MLTLSPSNAVAVTPGAWDEREARRRQAERLGSVEAIVLRLMAGVERNMARGLTIEQIAPVVKAWAGALYSMVGVVEVRPSRVGQQGGRLVLRAKHPAVIMELKPRVPRLLADLKTTGIGEVLWT